MPGDVVKQSNGARPFCTQSGEWLHDVSHAIVLFWTCEKSVNKQGKKCVSYNGSAMVIFCASPTGGTIAEIATRDLKSEWVLMKR